jgi:LL-diaminopimelate aminotransferase
MEKSERYKKLPVYLFAEIEAMTQKVAQTGIEIIDLAKGVPDQPPPPHIIKKHMEIVQEDWVHRYPITEGVPELRNAAAQWYKNRHDVDLDPESEIISLIGTREGIAHIFLVYINPGDITLIPDPGYPTYTVGTTISEGQPHYFPLREENGFLPDLASLDRDIARKAKLMFLNYPNNPTAAVAGIDFFEEVVAFARENDILICHDLAYSEIGFDDYKAPSFLSVPGAKEVGIEFYSLAKTYNMGGWRMGFAAGNRDAVQALARLKANIDCGVFDAIQYTAAEAMTASQDCIKDIVKVYEGRRDVLVNGLRAAGWDIPLPKGTLFVWAPVPGNYTAREFALHLLEKAGVAVVPGSAYGENGERYVRMALVEEETRMREAVKRIQEIMPF